MVGYPHDLFEDVIENILEFHDYDDASLILRPLGDALMNGVIHLFMRMF
jgi:hypothetical protein